MTQLPWRLALCAASLCVGLASAQPVSVRLETRTLHEGRPGAVRVVVEVDKQEQRAVLLRSLELELSQPEGSVTRGGSLVRTVHGLALDAPSEGHSPDDEGDRVVSLELRAIDDPGPAARAAMPDSVSTARGEEHRLLPLLARRTEEIRLRPRLSDCVLRVRWEAAVIPKQTPEGVFELAREQTWRPVEEKREAFGGPRTVFRLTTRHWRRWLGEQRGELLLTDAALGALPVYRGSLEARVTVRSARFGLRAAMSKAGLSTPLEAWRLPDDRWILQTGGEEPTYAVVGERTKTEAGKGDLRAIASDLAEGRATQIYWNGARGNPEFETVAKVFFEAQPTKSGSLSWKIDAKSLAPYLAQLREAGLEPAGTSVRR